MVRALVKSTIPLALAIALIGWGTESKAWGNDGHMVIAIVAKHIIDDHDQATGSRVGQAIEALLSSETDPSHGSGMVEAAKWADSYRSEGGAWTAKWHFADVEIDQAEPDLSKACFGDKALPVGVLAFGGPNHDARLQDECVVNKIDQFKKELADRSLPSEERKYALLFLLHFVGDIHQPLHASDDHDGGANGVAVVWGTNTSGTSLHSYWDTNTVHRLGATPELVASTLISDISASDMVAWSKKAPNSPGRDPRLAAWALESFATSKAIAYGQLPTPIRTCRITHRHGPPTMEHCRIINQTYAIAATGQARKQMQKAGVRLATLLIEALS